MHQPIEDLVFHYDATPEQNVPEDGVTSGYIYVWSSETGEVHSVTPTAAITLNGQTHYIAA